MILTEYDAESHIAMEKEWSKEEGKAEGKAEDILYNVPHKVDTLRRRVPCL